MIRLSKGPSPCYRSEFDLVSGPVPVTEVELAQPIRLSKLLIRPSFFPRSEFVLVRGPLLVTEVELAQPIRLSKLLSNKTQSLPQK